MTENIALIFEEVLTRIVRHRAGVRIFDDADSFRYDMREAVRNAAGVARTAGYRTANSVDGGSGDAGNGTKGDIEMCTLAVVAFLDESVTDQGVYAWFERSLSDEFFGHRNGGKYFFDNLENRLLPREDSPELADILEIHYLCLLLGFQGQFRGDGGQLFAQREKLKARIERVRGKLLRLCPAVAPDIAPRVRAAATLQKYVWAAVFCLLVTVGLFVSYSVSLSSGVSDLKALAARKS